MNRIISSALRVLWVGVLAGSGAALLQGPKDVIVGELKDPKDKTKDAITLYVHPCAEHPDKQTVSPYREVSGEDATCPGGRKYKKVTVEQAAAQTQSPDDDKKKQKKVPEKEDDQEKKDTPKPPNQGY